MENNQHSKMNKLIEKTTLILKINENIKTKYEPNKNKH